MDIIISLRKRKMAKIKQAMLLDVLRPKTSTRSIFRSRFKTYREYLQSTDWKQLKEIFYLMTRKICISCGDYEDLQLHHSTYNSLGTKYEILDLKVVCDHCHIEIHNLASESNLELNIATSLVVEHFN